MTISRTEETRSTETQSTETESTESNKIDIKTIIKEIEQKAYQTDISDLESFKKIFEKIQIGDRETPGFITLNEKFEKLGAKGSSSLAHLSFKKELNNILNKLHDSEKHEYNFHEANLRWIIADGEKNIDELITGLNHLNKKAANAGHMADVPAFFRHNGMASISIDVCEIASRTIDEINRFITKIENHITKPGSSPTLLEWGYLFTLPFKPDRRPRLLENDEIDMFKTYLKDLSERLEKIKLSALTNLDFINKESVENKMQKEPRISFLNEKKQGGPISPKAEEKKEISFKL